MAAPPRVRRTYRVSWLICVDDVADDDQPARPDDLAYEVEADHEDVELGDRRPIPTARFRRYPARGAHTVPPTVAQRGKPDDLLCREGPPDAAVRTCQRSPGDRRTDRDLRPIRGVAADPRPPGRSSAEPAPPACGPPTVTEGAVARRPADACHGGWCDRRSSRCTPRRSSSCRRRTRSAVRCTR